MKKERVKPNDIPSKKKKTKSERNNGNLRKRESINGTKRALNV